MRLNTSVTTPAIECVDTLNISQHGVVTENCSILITFGFLVQSAPIANILPNIGKRQIKFDLSNVNAAVTAQ